MKPLSLAARLWMPVIVLAAMTVVMTSMSIVRTHTQAESNAAQARQQAKLEASLKLLATLEAGNAERAAGLRGEMAGLLDTPRSGPPWPRPRTPPAPRRCSA
jgi:methyl-accepting chemotaxis protein